MDRSTAKVRAGRPATARCGRVSRAVASRRENCSLERRGGRTQLSHLWLRAPRGIARRERERDCAQRRADEKTARRRLPLPPLPREESSAEAWVPSLRRLRRGPPASIDRETAWQARTQRGSSCLLLPR
eukprot:scaffold455_cov155-Ochromonas_danica.AAC.8